MTFGSILSPADRTRSYLFPKSLCANAEEGSESTDEDEGHIVFDEPLFPRSYKPVAGKLPAHQKVVMNKSVDSANCNAGSRGGKKTMPVGTGQALHMETSSIPKVSKSMRKRQRRRNKKRKVSTNGESNPALPNLEVPGGKDPGPKETE